jgi:hypothetical protein
MFMKRLFFFFIKGLLGGWDLCNDAKKILGVFLGGSEKVPEILILMDFLKDILTF